MRSGQVDEYVATRVRPEQQPIVRALRDLVEEAAPQARLPRRPAASGDMLG
jgi:hypothetical protein